jgi:molybdenum cofactor cytidylyltransferase
MGCLLKANGLYSRTTIGAVLLAAGSGSRIGGRPKALLELGGVPLIVRQLVALSGAGIAAFPITIERNSEPDRGQASSVRIGLQALSPRLDAVMVALADQPLIDEADIVALIGAFKKRGDAAMVVPRVRGAGGEPLPGNPVIFDAMLRDEWLAGDVNAACRQWREQHPERVRWFDTDNAHYRIDIDTPEDLERFAETTGHALAWPAALASSTVAG